MKIRATIRQVRSEDVDGVRNLLLTAFPTQDESDLVNLVRRDGDAVYEIAAIVSGTVAGYCLFSKMRAPFPALGLGPVAVSPHARRRGVARQLIEKGIAWAQRDRWAGIFVLGDPDYYAGSGFDVGSSAGFDCRFAGAHFMGLPLTEKGFPVAEGTLFYAPAFDIFD